MNKKGITLVELIVSIALISIVIVFLFNILADVRYSNKNTDFNRNNQQKRAIIIKTIEEDFLEKEVVGITDNSTTSKFSITITYKDTTTGVIEIEGDYLSYKNSDGYEKWKLEKQSSNTYYNTSCITYDNSIYSVEDGEYFYFKIHIPIVVKEGSANASDDLEFSYVGLKSDITKSNFPNKTNLGKYNSNNCGK